MNRRKFITSSATLGGIVWVAKHQMGELSKIPQVTSRTYNPALKTILPNWKGTPLDEKGCFMNHEFPNTNEFSKALKWMVQKNPQKKIKQNDITSSFYFIIQTFGTIETIYINFRTKILTF